MHKTLDTNEVFYVGNGKFNILKEEYVGIWTNQRKCAEDLELNDKLLNNCLNNKRKHTKGYRFKYL